MNLFLYLVVLHLYLTWLNLLISLLHFTTFERNKDFISFLILIFLQNVNKLLSTLKIYVVAINRKGNNFWDYKPCGESMLIHKYF